MPPKSSEKYGNFEKINTLRLNLVVILTDIKKMGINS